jgi:glucose-6-phosphate 1-epimerase
LYLSPKSLFTHDKAIRGGVPICWPQFSDMGAFPQAHGFARIDNRWTLDEVASRQQDTLVLQLDVENMGRLTYTLAILDGESVSFGLSFQNTTASALTFTTALHTYFTTTDVHRTTVTGCLDQCVYADNLQKRMEMPAAEVRDIDKEIDRIYKATNGQAVNVHIPTAPDASAACGSGAAGGYTVVVTAEGLPDTVLWNPWIEKTKKMADLPEDAYVHFVCVESGSIHHKVTVEPGATWSGAQRVQIVGGSGSSHI